MKKIKWIRFISELLMIIFAGIALGGWMCFCSTMNPIGILVFLFFGALTALLIQLAEGCGERIRKDT